VTLAWVEMPALTLAATSAMAATPGMAGQVATLAMAARASPLGDHGGDDGRGHSLPSTDCSE
jgi:hypothetical protein